MPHLSDGHGEVKSSCPDCTAIITLKHKGDIQQRMLKTQAKVVIKHMKGMRSY